MEHTVRRYSHEKMKKRFVLTPKKAEGKRERVGSGNTTLGERDMVPLERKNLNEIYLDGSEIILFLQRSLQSSPAF